MVEYFTWRGILNAIRVRLARGHPLKPDIRVKGGESKMNEVLDIIIKLLQSVAAVATVLEILLRVLRDLLTH